MPAMKLVVGIVHGRDKGKIADELVSAGFKFTLFGSTGGFLREGSATFLIGLEESDIERYQTVFAKNEGAVAAPTAGLHFSREILKRLEIKGVQFAPLTLHIGLGTFRTVEVEDLTKHKTESEEVLIPKDTCRIINAAKEKRKKEKEN